MARKLHEGAPPESNRDMGGKDFGVSSPYGWQRSRGVNPEHMKAYMATPEAKKHQTEREARHKKMQDAAKAMKSKHPKRV